MEERVAGRDGGWGEAQISPRLSHGLIFLSFFISFLLFLFPSSSGAVDTLLSIRTESCMRRRFGCSGKRNITLWMTSQHHRLAGQEMIIKHL